MKRSEKMKEMKEDELKKGFGQESENGHASHRRQVHSRPALVELVLDKYKYTYKLIGRPLWSQIAVAPVDGDDVSGGDVSGGSTLLVTFPFTSSSFINYQIVVVVVLGDAL